MTHNTESDKTVIAAGLLSAMANPKRLQILCVLAEDEMHVGALAARVGLSQSALSQHLSKLRAQNLVETRREAQTIYYSTHAEPVQKLLATLDDIYEDGPDWRGRLAS
nr:metalloregulator ArsR/SmtB family transcription factor [Marinicella sp. W31]MDC2878461.1 metalloregulator ArsR/SmtB family transcription factor [Marinicella sp. W31]